MKCPTCKANVMVDGFKRPAYGDPRESADPAKPAPFRYVQSAWCDNGHELLLRDGAALELTPQS